MEAIIIVLIACYFVFVYPIILLLKGVYRGWQHISPHLQQQWNYWQQRQEEGHKPQKIVQISQSSQSEIKESRYRSQRNLEDIF